MAHTQEFDPLGRELSHLIQEYRVVDGEELRVKLEKIIERELAEARKQLEPSPCKVEGHRRCDWFVPVPGDGGPCCLRCAEIKAAEQAPRVGRNDF